MGHKCHFGPCGPTFGHGIGLCGVTHADFSHKPLWMILPVFWGWTSSHLQKRLDERKSIAPSLAAQVDRKCASQRFVGKICLCGPRTGRFRDRMWVHMAQNGICVPPPVSHHCAVAAAAAAAAVADIMRSSLSVCHFAIRWPRVSLSGGHFAISCAILLSFAPNLCRLARRRAIAILYAKDVDQ